MTLIRNVVLVCCALSLPALAQGTPAAAPAPAPGPTFQADVAGVIGHTQKEMVSLAGAVPQNKFTWRPAKGVRSVAEVYLHAAGSAYWFGKQIGFQVPADVEAKMKDFEKSTTDKAKIIATLKDSFAHARQAIKAMPDADLEKSMDWFGGKNTERGVLLFIVRHGAKHLGQSIAYSRMAGVVPPWTEDAQKKKAENKAASKE